MDTINLRQRIPFKQADDEPENATVLDDQGALHYSIPQHPDTEHFHRTRRIDSNIERPKFDVEPTVPTGPRGRCCRIMYDVRPLFFNPLDTPINTIVSQPNHRRRLAFKTKSFPCHIPE